MSNSNYGESATIRHEPEVGDVYRVFGNSETRIHITDVGNKYIEFITENKSSIGFVYSVRYLKDGDVRYDNFNNFYIYLGKAKNPITSIFEVE